MPRGGAAPCHSVPQTQTPDPRRSPDGTESCRFHRRVGFIRVSGIPNRAIFSISTTGRHHFHGAQHQKPTTSPRKTPPATNPRNPTRNAPRGGFLTLSSPQNTKRTWVLRARPWRSPDHPPSPRLVRRTWAHLGAPPGAPPGAPGAPGRTSGAPGRTSRRTWAHLGAPPGAPPPVAPEPCESGPSKNRQKNQKSSKRSKNARMVWKLCKRRLSSGNIDSQADLGVPGRNRPKASPGTRETAWGAKHCGRVTPKSAGRDKLARAATWDSPGEEKNFSGCLRHLRKAAVRTSGARPKTADPSRTVGQACR